MNLIQTQDRLKDEPLQVVMSYANGGNPEVPPFLALSELQRRKRMSQSRQEAPKETVKDRLEREASEQSLNLLNTQQAQQQQSAQQMQQQAAQPTGQIPEGTPQPPMPEQPQAMASGGITRLPTGDMFNYRDGGIVAFAEGDKVVEKPKTSRFKRFIESFDDPEKRKLFDDQQTKYQEQIKAYQNQPGVFEETTPEAIQTSEEDIQRAASARREAPQSAPKPQPVDPVYYNPETATRRADLQGSAAPAPQPAPAGRPNVRPAAPAAPRPSGVDALPRQDSAMDMLKQSAEMMKQQPEVPPDYASAMEAAKRTNPELAQPAGSGYEKLLEEIRTRDAENRAKAAEREKGRGRADAAQALIDAGEATRGQRGIGALFGGFGKSMIAANAAADERAARQEALEREQDLNMAKMRSEIETLRRAEARGDVAAQQASLAKIADIKNTMQQNKMVLQAHTGQTAAMMRGQNITADTATQDRLSRERTAGAQISAMQTPELFRIMDRLKTQYPNLSEEQLMQKALPYTRAGIGAEGKLDVATEARLKKLDEARLRNSVMYANDPTKLAAANKTLDDEERRIRGGIGGLPTGGGGNTRIKVDANGVPIQ